MVVMGVLAALVAVCAVFIPFVLAVAAWLDRRDARRTVVQHDGAPSSPPLDPMKPPTSIADEVERWLRDHG
jgi:hypothetical protein